MVLKQLNRGSNWVETAPNFNYKAFNKIFKLKHFSLGIKYPMTIMDNRSFLQFAGFVKTLINLTVFDHKSLFF